jgi:hypothetical protein
MNSQLPSLYSASSSTNETTTNRKKNTMALQAQDNAPSTEPEQVLLEKFDVICPALGGHAEKLSTVGIEEINGCLTPESHERIETRKAQMMIRQLWLVVSDIYAQINNNKDARNTQGGAVI